MMKCKHCGSENVGQIVELLVPRVLSLVWFCFDCDRKFESLDG